MEEEIPVNTPKERGMGFLMVPNVDSEHASNAITRQSRTGFIIIYLNSSPIIYWLCKKQNDMKQEATKFPRKM